MIALKLLIWIAFIVCNALFDQWFIDNKGRPNYLVEFILRGMAAILHGGLVFDVQNTFDYLPLFFFQITSFWGIFNPLLNELRGKTYFHQGSNSGYLDRYFVKHPAFYKFCYFLALIVCAVSVIVIYSK